MSIITVEQLRYEVRANPQIAVKQITTEVLYMELEYRKNVEKKKIGGFNPIPRVI